MIMSLERRAKELNLTLKAMTCKRGTVLSPVGFFFFPKRFLQLRYWGWDQRWGKFGGMATDGKAFVIIQVG